MDQYVVTDIFHTTRNMMLAIVQQSENESSQHEQIHLTENDFELPRFIYSLNYE
jgi:hypothetical protein